MRCMRYSCGAGGSHAVHAVLRKCWVGEFGAKVFFWFGLHLTSDVGAERVAHAVLSGRGL